MHAPRPATPHPHAIALVAVVLLGLLGAGCAPNERAAAPPATTTAATEATFPDEGLATTTTGPAPNKRVGQVLTLVDVDANQEVAKVLVNDVRFSRGDEFNRPERAYYLGVHVKVQALVDGMNSLWGDFYVLMRGHHYEADACCPEGFSRRTGWPRRPPRPCC
jgi:hypothetical protein